MSPTTVEAIYWLSSQSYIDGHEERDGVRDRLDGDLPAVNRQHAGAILAEAGTVVEAVRLRSTGRAES